MREYTFMLTFRLPDRNGDPKDCLDRLYEEGCDDASVGIGQAGRIGLDFTRAAQSAEDALGSAVNDVMRAIPGVVLIQAGPDFVGLTEMAEIFGFSRQNMRKYASGQIRTVGEAFPEPVISGNPSLWHLAEIAAWLKLNTAHEPDAELVEVSKAAAKLNLETETRRVREFA